jgi:hypothetical protein
MTSNTKHLNRQTDPVRRETIAPGLDAYASRFHTRVRREVRQLIRVDPRFADLARVFPGAAAAIVSSGSAPLANRRAALDLVRQGAPLKTVARALSLPLWLRRLPPEAFTGAALDAPQSEAFSRRISARLPGPSAESVFWLASVCFAARSANDDFALWLAEQPLFEEGGDAGRLFPVLAAYAWFSGQPQTEAGSLIVVPWRPQVAFDTAICAAKSWLNRLRLVLLLAGRPIADPWLAPGAANGFTFEPLLDAPALLAEAHGMQNCADQYAERLVRDRCRLFSVRRGSTRTATIEISAHPREAGVLAISQLKARHNMPATIEVWQASLAWLATQSGLKRMPPLVVPERAVDLARWKQLMAPYRAAKAGAPWLVETMTPGALATLDADMADLARRGGVTSWLFT